MGGEIATNQTESSRSIFRHDDRGYPRLLFCGEYRYQWELILPEIKQSLRDRFFVIMTGGTLGIFFAGSTGANGS